MSAKEMFEKLGYKLKIKCANNIEYEKGTGITIRFSNSYIEKFVNTTAYNNCDYTYGFITLNELQAINKQVEELGWEISNI